MKKNKEKTLFRLSSIMNPGITLCLLFLFIILLVSGCTPATPNDGNGNENSNGNGNHVIDSHYIEMSDYIPLNIMVERGLCAPLLQVFHYYGEALDIKFADGMHAILDPYNYGEKPNKAIEIAKSYGLEGVIHFLDQSDMKKIMKKDIPLLVYHKTHPETSSEIWYVYKGFDDAGTPDPLKNIYTEEKGIFIVDDSKDRPETPYWGYGPNWEESYKDFLARIPDGGDEHYCLIIYEPGTNLWEGFSTIPPEASWPPEWSKK